MGRVRVSALAKELGITSGEALAWLLAHGEDVKSSASMIGDPAVRRLRAAYPSLSSDAQPSREGQAHAAAEAQLQTVPHGSVRLRPLPVVHDLPLETARLLIDALALGPGEQVLLVAKHAEDLLDGHRVLVATTARILDKRGLKPAAVPQYDRIQDLAGLVGIEDVGDRLLVLVFANGLRWGVEHAASFTNRAQTQEIRGAFRTALDPFLLEPPTSTQASAPQEMPKPTPQGEETGEQAVSERQDGKADSPPGSSPEAPLVRPPDGERFTWCRAPRTEKEKGDIEDLLDQLEDTAYVHAFLSADFTAGKDRPQVDVVLLCAEQLWCIEVKSWEGKLEGGDQDWRQLPEGKLLKPNPHRQAKGHAQALGSVLRRRLGKKRLFVDLAVWLPRAASVELVPGLDECVFGNADGLRPAWELVGNRSRSWDVNTDEVKGLLFDVLVPKIRGGDD